MAKVVLSARALEDCARFELHLDEFEARSKPTALESMLAAFRLLESSPNIGRPARNGSRELVIGKSSRGYVALYRYFAAIDTVIVLAVRHQRERGYRKH